MGVTPLTLRGVGECWAYSGGRQSEFRPHLRRLENRDGRGLDEPLTWGVLTVLCTQVSCPDGLQYDGRQEGQLPVISIHPPQAFRAFKISPSESLLPLFWGVDGSIPKSMTPSPLVQLPCLPRYFLLLFLHLPLDSRCGERPLPPSALESV